jgi:tetratricopeptide (TPR) repeat protein
MNKIDLFYKYYDAEKYRDAILILKKLPLVPKDKAWIFAKICECYYELRKYKIAVRYGKKSLEFQKNYPIALWNLGNSLYYIKEYRESIVVLKKLTNISDEVIGNKETQLGVKWAKSLRMDTNLKIALNYYALYKDAMVRKHLKIYKELKKQNNKSCIPKHFLIKWVRILSNV